jgi:hypothetical protein
VELVSQVLRNSDDSRCPVYDPASYCSDAGQLADVPDIAAMCGHHQRSVHASRDESRWNKKVRPHDVWSGRPSNLVAQLEEPSFAAGTAIQHREVQVVSSLVKRVRHLGDKDPEIGVAWPRKHLRHDQDVHG